MRVNRLQEHLAGSKTVFGCQVQAYRIDGGRAASCRPSFHFVVIDMEGMQEIVLAGADTGISHRAHWRVAPDHHSCRRRRSNMERL
jgi:hypothetical protein